MSQRRSKRKRPGREEHMLSEQVKVESGGVFDNKTMLFLSKFFNKGIVEKLGFPIARGKEADLYIADAGSKATKFGRFIVLKFFRIETSSFYKMDEYILGDPRFSKISRSKYGIIMTWCRKEFGNLEIAQLAKVSAPKPIMFNGSILALSFVGDPETGNPAPQLKDVELENPDAVLSLIIKNIAKLYTAGLVHSDMSEYNILIDKGKPVFIDFGQAVVTRHPKAMDFLRRDISNIVQYFAKAYGIKRDPHAILDSITSQHQGK